MLIRAILILAIGFGFLFFLRVGGAWRQRWLSRWPAVVFAIAAIFEGARGGLSLAAGLAALAVVSWFLAPVLLAPRPAGSAPADPADVQARAVLGLSPNAGEAEIRRAYRAKMRNAHPDQGGAHADAARLTAARDRLLGKRR